MIIKGPKITLQKNYVELSVRVHPEHLPYLPQRIWWRFPSEYAEFLSRDGNAFIPAFLLPCMLRGERLVIEAPVSGQLLQEVPKIQGIYKEWYKQAQDIEVTAPIRPNSPRSGLAVGSFFSGGVDSFHTLLKNQEMHVQGSDDAITHLIFSAGFDVKLKKKALLERLQNHLDKISIETKTPLISVSLNLKAFGDRYINWVHYFGPFLASLGLLFEPLFRQIYIPSSLAWDQLVPMGSHPELDILWSTEGIRFIHDGCESTRLEKIVDWLSKSPLIPEHLHVCWKNKNVFYNCGVCEKCIRTMIPLYLGTGRTEFPCFSHPLDPEKIRLMQLKENTLIYALESLTALKKRDTDFDVQVQEALQDVIDRFRLTKA